MLQRLRSGYTMARCMSSTADIPAGRQCSFVLSNIVFGSGQAATLPEAIAGNKKTLVVIGTRAPAANDVVALMQEKSNCVVLQVVNEPSIEDIEEGLRVAAACDCVVSIGGGSAIDTGKAIAALAGNGGDPLDYLEVIGKGQALTKRSLHHIAVPTTAGTGAEVTKNAVLSSKEHQVKVSLRSDFMVPDVALIDPALALTVPAAVTAATGADALVQCLEPFVSCKATPFTDPYAREGMVRASRSLRRAVFDGKTDLDAREDMALCAVFGGIALANAKLGAVHGFAGVIGGLYPRAPHGSVCAALLAPCFEANVQALKVSKDANAPAYLARFEESAKILVGSNKATVDDAVEWCNELTKDIGISSLRSFGLEESSFDVIVQQSAKSSSMAGNPIPLSHGALRDILVAASR